MKKAKSLIACPIFKDELDMLLSPASGLTVELLDYRIHINARKMEDELTEAIARAKNTGSDICLLLGCECNCERGIKKIAEDAKARYPLEKNCLEIILGPERAKELQKNRTSIITQGWINMVNDFIESGIWTEVDARINFGHHDRLLLLDYGGTPLTDEEIISFYDRVQVPVEIEQVDLHYFQEVLNRLLE